jgi:hypothetical protein
MTHIDVAVLEWGIRQSFVAYVERLPDGVIQASGGAVREADVFRFPGRRRSSGAWAFDGALHFSGYSGVLDVTFEAIRVEGSELSAEVSGARIPLASLAGPTGSGEADGEASGVRFDTVVLTADGAAALGGVYSVNTPADPVPIRAVGDPARDIISARVRTP